MSARDTIHEPVRKALINDGWRITNDPLVLKVGRRVAKADLGAERLIGATRNQEKIAVEIKSFRHKSALTDFEKALGQYIVYSNFLQQLDPDRKVYLAISEAIYSTVFQEEPFQIMVRLNNMRLIIINIDNKEVVQWID